VVRGLAVGVGSAKGVCADISALRLSVVAGALGRSGTVLVPLALHGGDAARVVGVADGAGWTVALEGSVGPFAGGSWSTRSLSAEINEGAASEGVSSEARLAVANLLVVVGRAEGVGSARVVHQTGNLARLSVAEFVSGTVGVLGALDPLAAGGRVAKVTLETGAERLVVLGGAAGVAAAEGAVAGVHALVLADGVGDALFVTVAVGVLTADQLLHADVVLAELELRTSVVGSASWLANSLDAKLVSNAVAVAQTLS